MEKAEKTLLCQTNATRSKLLQQVACLAAMLLLAAPVLTARDLSTRKLLWISDIHFNPMADPSLVRDLAAADPAQWEAILGRSKLTSFSQYGQDTNWWLLHSTLDQLHATLPGPALVIYTGDILAHGFHPAYIKATGDSDLDHYRAFVLKTTRFVALQLGKRFSNTQILLAPGNNDDDCGDYAIEPNGPFLHDTAELVRELARGDATSSDAWTSLGSYGVLHATVNKLRILSLNTVFMSQQYRPESFATGCKATQSSGAEDVLNWLAAKLAKAEHDHERVWLIFHIPPGIDGYASTHPRPAESQVPGSSTAASCPGQIVPMWVPRWTVQFDSLLERYRDTVIASFAGHTHVDDFRLIRANGADQNFVLITPAISPIYDQNPAFRVVDFTSEGRVVGQSTYYLTNLKQASSTKRGRWRREYRFDHAWKVPLLDAESLGRIYAQVERTTKARNRWARLYMVSSPEVSFPPSVLRGLYCGIGSLDPGSYQSCYCLPEGSSAGRPRAIAR